MSYCLNPVCSAPQNSADEVCQSCGTALKLCDRYRALKPIGQGGFGRTFLAVDLSESMKPRCVIKQLYPQQQGAEMQAKASDLFRQEAQQLLTAGQYPSIPKFLDYFEQDGYQYLVQEFIEGQNLAEVLRAGRTFTESEVKGLLETMLETIDFLHHRKIIHRDIKPANIIQTLNGRFVLVDLGAAKLMTGTALGQTGTVIGSAEYVAPEQLRGKAIFASDLYSLGATCVTLLTGMSPFSLFDTSTGSWEWRDYLSAPVGDRLGKVLDRLLMGPTKQRYKSADEVLQDLEEPSLGKESPIDPWQKEALVETTENTSEGRFPFWGAAPTAELEIERAEAGNVVGRGKNNQRGNRFHTFQMIIVFVGYGLLIQLQEFNKGGGFNFHSGPEQPVAIPKIAGASYPVSNYVKPTYNNPVKPVKTFKSDVPFESMALKDSGNTIVTGHLSTNGKLTLQSINIKTDKKSKFISQLSTLERYKSSIYIESDSLFLWSYLYSGDTILTILNLDQKTVVPLPEDLKGKFIFPTFDGKALFERTENSDLIWKIMSNGEIVKAKPLADFNKPYSREAYSHDSYGCSLISPDGEKIFRSGLSPDSLSQWKASTGNLEVGMTGNWESKTRGSLKSQKFGLLNPCAISQNQKKEIVIANVSNQDENRKLDAFRSSLPSFYQVNDEIINYQGIVHIWEIKDHKIKYSLPRPGLIKSLATSPDAKTLTMVESTGKLKLTIWDLPTGKFLREVSLKNINRAESNIVFSPDGKTVVVGVHTIDPEKTVTPDIYIWNVDELRNP